jgi:hypothetical protein
MVCDPTNANQRWAYSPATGQFKTHRNKCLDAYAMERVDPIIVYPCTGAKNQKWNIDSRGRIVMREAGPSGQRYCVTIANGERSDGARLWLQTCHRGENQLFRRDPSGMGGSTVSIESDLRSPDTDPACVDVPARELGAEPGLQAWLWDCRGTEHANQRWQRTAEMEFRLAVTVGTAREMCLDGGAGTGPRPVTIQRCHSGASQKWNMGANGEIQLQSGHKPCLHAPGESNHNGNKLVLLGETEACAPVVVGGQRWSYRDPR